MAQAVFYTGRHGGASLPWPKAKASPLWQCLSHHFDEFLEAYKERSIAGTWPAASPASDDHCKEDRLLALSCKGRWFCPSCHQKKVQLFGRCWPRASSIWCRTGISCSASPRCSAGRNDLRSVARRPLPRLRHRTGRGVLRHLKCPAAPRVRLSAPLVQRPPALRRQLFRVAGAPRKPEKARV